jgi:formamidopyrimidine-DNA glycosylase
LKDPITDVGQFNDRLIGSTFVNARRRGKHLIFGLDTGYALYAHLNMRGQILVAQNIDLPNGKYLCLAIRFMNGFELRYHDMWRWGEIRLILDSQEEISKSVPALTTMGDEPLSQSFNGAALHARAHLRPSSPIKAVLLDQAVVAGVGNIYADESLYRAGIAPLRKTKTLTENEWQKLATEIKGVLCEAVYGGGTESDNYVDVDGNVGHYQPQVYGRAQECCKNCETPLMKIKIGGRSAVYCPQCQQ